MRSSYLVWKTLVPRELATTTETFLEAGGHVIFGLNADVAKRQRWSRLMVHNLTEQNCVLVFVDDLHLAAGGQNR